MERRPSPASLATSSAAALSTRNISTRNISTRGLSTRACSYGASSYGDRAGLFKTRVTGRVIRALPGARRTPGPSPPLADGAARTDRLASGYGHYRADHSKELVIQKTGAQEGVFPSTGPGVCGKPPRVPGTRRGRARQGQGDAKVKGTPNTLSTPASTSASRNPGGGTAGGLCAMVAAAIPASPASRKPGGDTATAVPAQFRRASGKAGALPGRPGARPPQKKPSWLGVSQNIWAWPS